jgi:WD40 repeat protein
MIDLFDYNSSLIQLLYKFIGGEIIEFGGGEDRRNNAEVKNMSSEVLVYSHSGGELWGLAVHPNIPDLYVTVGDDCTLRVWSLNLNKMIHSVDLGSAARSVTFHPSGTVLAVGFMERKKSGGNKDKEKEKDIVKEKEKEKEKDKDKEKNKRDGQMKSENVEGAVHLYLFNVDTTSTSNSTSSNSNVSNYAAISVLKVSHGCDTVAWVNDVTFSPTGEILAVGSHDKKMYFYGIPGIPQGGGPFGDMWGQCLKKTKFVFDKHSSAVLHADFSSDGKYMQTDSQVTQVCVCVSFCLQSVQVFLLAFTSHV